MRFIEVTFANGNTLRTSINGTDAEITAYYVGQWFNLGVEADDMQQAVSVAFIPESVSVETIASVNRERLYQKSCK